jgi:hypothetical protein
MCRGTRDPCSMAALSSGATPGVVMRGPIGALAYSDGTAVPSSR